MTTWADLARMSSDDWVTAERAATIAALDRDSHQAALAEASERELRNDDPGSYRVNVGEDPWTR
jgi:hypothetical protein